MSALLVENTLIEGQTKTKAELGQAVGGPMSYTGLIDR